MRIWFDVSGIYHWQGNFTGIQRIVYNLGKELSTRDDVSFFIYRHTNFHEVLFNELEEKLKSQIDHQQRDQRRLRERLTLAKVQHHTMVGLKRSVKATSLEAPARAVYSNLRHTYRVARRQKIEHTTVRLFAKNDTVLVIDGNWQFPGYAEALTTTKAKIGFKLVHFVNDLIALRNPSLANPGAERIIGKYFKKIFKNTDLLIAISNSTKKDIEWYVDKHDLKPTTVKVITLGDDIDTSHEALAKKPDQSIPKPFILAVGTLEIRKNYRLLYYGYKLAAQQSIELPHLVICGRKGWMHEETEFLLTRDIDLADKVTILKRATDQELRWLYKECEFTVFPSMYEGWGLPIAESLAYGKCCITTNVSAMPEVGLQFASYVSPYNTVEMLEEIKRLSNKQYRQKIEQKISSSYGMTTWQQSAADLMTIIKDTEEDKTNA